MPPYYGYNVKKMNYGRLSGRPPEILKKSHAIVPKNKTEHRKRKHKDKRWDEEK